MTPVSNCELLWEPGTPMPEKPCYTISVANDSGSLALRCRKTFKPQHSMNAGNSIKGGYCGQAARAPGRKNTNCLSAHNNNSHALWESGKKPVHADYKSAPQGKNLANLYFNISVLL